MISRVCITLILTLTASGYSLAQPDSYGYDLRSNLALAHSMAQGPIADASHVGFSKYVRDLQGRWTPGVLHQGAKAAFTPGLQANLWLPMGADLPREKRLEFRLAPLGKDQRMDVFVQGKKIGHKVLKPGWQTHSFDLPDNLGKGGDIHVRLHFRRTVTHRGKRTAAALRYLRVAGRSAPVLPAQEAALTKGIAGAAGDALSLPAGSGLDWFIVPQPATRLKGTVSGGPVEVWAQTGGAKPRRLGAGGALDIDLTAIAGKPVRLMLRAKAAAQITGAHITGGRPGKPTASKAPKYVVFWLIDTLRADKLEFYLQKNANGRAKVRTPNLSALAKEATTFQNFWVQGNESKASHASLFTGTYPAVHRVYGHKSKLAGKFLTIAETFTQAGYLSAGYVSNGYISSRWNFAQGFNPRVFTNFIREGKANHARAIYQKAKKFIDKHRARPFYLYLGTSDPHVTYRAHKGVLKNYDRKPYKGRYRRSLSGPELGKLKGRKRPPRLRDRQRIEALYENEIEFNDIYFGKLVEHLKAVGIYDQTMIIISADHGDEFWEHGSCGHGHNLHQELVSVPLMIRMPGWFPKGKRIQFGVDGVDLLPTIQRVMGQGAAPQIQGEDLVNRVWSEGPFYPVAQIASMGTKRYALKVGPAKVIMASPSAIKAYDTDKDPAELSNIFDKKPIYVRAALDPLLLFARSAKAWKKGVWGPPNNLKRAFETSMSK